MMIAKRLSKLEGSIPPDKRVTFVLVEPPAGLSREAHTAWLVEQGLETGRCFTMDLGAASLARLHE